MHLAPTRRQQRLRARVPTVLPGRGEPAAPRALLRRTAARTPGPVHPRRRIDEPWASLTAAEALQREAVATMRLGMAGVARAEDAACAERGRK